jgi:hypothetical protein
VTAVHTDRFPVVSAVGRSSFAPQRALPAADLHVATVDPTGRVWLRLSARLLGWVPGQRLSMAVRDGVVHVSGEADKKAGIDAALDERHRVRVPFGIRAMVGFHAGIRVLVVTVPADRSVAILAVHRVVAAFGAVP